MKPAEDPTQVLDDLRAAMLSQLLVAGTTRFDFGKELASGPQSYETLKARFELADRPAAVLCTAMRAMGLIQVNSDNLIELSGQGREKLDPDSLFNLRGYIGLGAYSADVQKMIQCLEDDAPAGDISYVFHEGRGPSALDDPQTSDGLTRAMAARARNVAPFLAGQLDLTSASHILDVGGAHGIYSYELLKSNPQLEATIVDREPPLAVAREYAEAVGLSDRVELVFGDIHNYHCSRECDVVLMANILHDYSADDARRLVGDYAAKLPSGGRLIILDAFLDSVPAGAPPVSTGPRPVAAYSAMLFSICEGRCYRLDEYQSMLRDAGLQVDPTVLKLPAHGSVLTGTQA